MSRHCDLLGDVCTTCTAGTCQLADLPSPSKGQAFPVLVLVLGILGLLALLKQATTKN